MGSPQLQISWEKLPPPYFPSCRQLPTEGQVTPMWARTQDMSECPEPRLRQERAKEKKVHAFVRQLFIELPL